ncbi:MAG: hypothetical protein HQK96_18495 [Nitrospirae bacterium]|nr:hypothetical protein [Nitrospirota bacterium]
MLGKIRDILIEDELTELDWGKWGRRAGTAYKYGKRIARFGKKVAKGIGHGISHAAKVGKATYSYKKKHKKAGLRQLARVALGKSLELSKKTKAKRRVQKRMKHKAKSVMSKRPMQRKSIKRPPIHKTVNRPSYVSKKKKGAKTIYKYKV